MVVDVSCWTSDKDLNMTIPSIFQSGIATILYLFLFFIVGMGLWQFIQIYFISHASERRLKSLIPLGSAATVLGVIGIIQGYINTMETIEAVGDISPAIVAQGFKNSFSYGVLGLLSLAASFIFRYLNALKA